MKVERKHHKKYPYKVFYYLFSGVTRVNFIGDRNLKFLSPLTLFPLGRIQNSLWVHAPSAPTLVTPLY